MTGLDDQAAAGAIMWVPGSIAFLLPAAWIVAQMLSPQRNATALGGFRQGKPVQTPGCSGIILAPGSQARQQLGQAAADKFHGHRGQAQPH
jgi:hypothetical protein